MIRPAKLSRVQAMVLRASGFDPVTGAGRAVMVEGGYRNSARCLVRQGLGDLGTDEHGAVTFTASREGCRVHYADDVAAFEQQPARKVLNPRRRP